MDILRHARIARVTPGEDRSFAFVHRRFLEYLVTTVFIERPEQLPQDHIPTDSRGRDALVLYAQVCSEDEAARLANYCWAEVQAHFHYPTQRLRGVHCLRFLIDAFRSRRAVVMPFADELATFIAHEVSKGENLVLAKICLEGTGLLPDSKALPILQGALGRSNVWLQETAFRACRNLPRLQSELRASITDYVMGMPIPQFWKSYRALRFSLSLSDSLKDVAKAARRRHINLVVSALAVPFAVVVAPSPMLVALAISSLLLVARLGVDTMESLLLNSREEKAIAEAHGQREPIQVYRAFAVFSLWFHALADNDSQFPTALDTVIVSLIESQSDVHAAALLMIVGLLLVDWQWLCHLWSGCASILRGQLHLKSVGFLGSLLRTLLAAGFGVWGVSLIGRDQLGWVVLTLGGIFSAAMIFMVLGGLMIAARQHFTDRKCIDLIAITTRMPRTDIAAAFESLHTSRWRLRFVRRLAAQKVIAYGGWPEGFRLSVGADIAVTELARLEERWLKLDR